MPTSLLDLPPEIRIKIYTYYLETPEDSDALPFYCWPFSHQQPRTVLEPLYLSCRMIYFESYEIVLGLVKESKIKYGGVFEFRGLSVL